jgi:hypothetical protein
MHAILATPHRRAVRRAIRTPCHAVSDMGFELLSEVALDLSPMGMRIVCDAPAALGETVLVSVMTPGPQPIWIDAEAEITRIIHGFRRGDPGYCAGLRFTYLERRARGELLSRLAGLPPPIPQRRIQTARQRMTSHDRHFMTTSSAVSVRPVYQLSQRHGTVPAGVFWA